MGLLSTKLFRHFETHQCDSLGYETCHAVLKTTRQYAVLVLAAHSTHPDSLVVTASASAAVGRGFAPGPRHTKGGKNGTGSSLADARNKRVVPGRYKKAGRYSLLVMSQ